MTKKKEFFVAFAPNAEGRDDAAMVAPTLKAAEEMASKWLFSGTEGVLILKGEVSKVGKLSQPEVVWKAP